VFNVSGRRTPPPAPPHKGRGAQPTRARIEPLLERAVLLLQRPWRLAVFDRDLIFLHIGEGHPGAVVMPPITLAEAPPFEECEA